MNKVILYGRLVADPIINKGDRGVSYLRNTLAVSTDKVNDDGSKECIFVNFVAFDKIANVIFSYVKKGERLLIEGKLNCGSYLDSEGSKKYFTDVIVEQVKLI